VHPNYFRLNVQSFFQKLFCGNVDYIFTVLGWVTGELALLEIFAVEPDL
jgi:hypothetical protein